MKEHSYASYAYCLVLSFLVGTAGAWPSLSSMD
jgi:hypothetical protein